MNSNLPYEGWKRSHDKWKLIVKAVKNRKSFSNNEGFSDLPVVEKCAYCAHYLSCDNCPLAKMDDTFQMVVCRSANFHIYPHVPKSIFWEFIYEMRKHSGDIDWKKALCLSRIKLAAIKNNGRELEYI